MEIAFLGDSLTEGWPGASYMERLARLLPGITLLNLGRAGDTVADLAQRLPHSGLGPVDKAFIWVGVNDAFAAEWRAPLVSGDWEADLAAWWRDELVALRRTYAELLAFTLQRAASVTCVLPLLPDGYPDEGVEGRVRAVAAAVAETAAATARTRPFDLAPAFAAARAATPEGRFTIDGIHLTERGADVVARAFAGLVRATESLP